MSAGLLRLQLPFHLLIFCLHHLLPVFSEIYSALSFIICIDEVLEGSGAFLTPDLLLKADIQLPVLEGDQIV